MKKVLKISVVVVFMTALFANVSIDAYKSAKGINLFGIISEANAKNECNSGAYLNGKCSFSNLCHLNVFDQDCMF